MVRTSYTKRIAALVLSFAGILLIGLGMTGAGRRCASAVFRPFLFVWGRGAEFLAKQREAFENKEEERAERNRLLLSELLAQQRGFEDVLLENAQLREMLKLEPPVGWHPVRAELLTRDPVTWNWEFTISKGASSGIECGNPVLLDNCLAGRVSEVFNESAKVVTLASPQCKFSVIVKNAGGEEFPGIIKGRGGMCGGDEPACFVDYMPKRAMVAPGDQVETSGLGTELPPGIPVGYLVNSRRGLCPEIPDDARAAADVKPVADFYKFFFVTVYIKSRDIK